MVFIDMDEKQVGKDAMFMKETCMREMLKLSNCEK